MYISRTHTHTCTIYLCNPLNLLQIKKLVYNTAATAKTSGKRGYSLFFAIRTAFLFQQFPTIIVLFVSCTMSVS